MKDKKFITFQETVAFRCRWAEYAQELFGDWEIIWEDSTEDYQGKATILAHKEGKFGYLTWEYGSCAGCDSWEEMNDDARRADFKNATEYFDNVHALKKFVDQVNYGEEFEKAVAEYMFYAQLEEKLQE